MSVLFDHHIINKAVAQKNIKSFGCSFALFRAAFRPEAFKEKSDRPLGKYFRFDKQLLQKLVKFMIFLFLILLKEDVQAQQQFSGIVRMCFDRDVFI